MDDDFFNRIDTKLGERKAAKAVVDEAAETNLAFVKALIPRLAEIAERYASKCNERGMAASVKYYDYSITFSLRYRNGSVRSLVGGIEHDKTNKLAFEDHFPNDDGKRYKSMPMEWYDASNWTDDRYEAKLKKLIEDFVFYADRFGGIEG